jgi:hypothetical protein
MRLSSQFPRQVVHSHKLEGVLVNAKPLVAKSAIRGVAGDTDLGVVEEWALVWNFRGPVLYTETGQNRAFFLLVVLASFWPSRPVLMEGWLARYWALVKDEAGKSAPQVRMVEVSVVLQVQVPPEAPESPGPLGQTSESPFVQLMVVCLPWSSCSSLSE